MWQNFGEYIINQAGTVKSVRAGCSKNVRASYIFFGFGYKFFAGNLSLSRSNVFCAKLKAAQRKYKEKQK